MKAKETPLSDVELRKAKSKEKDYKLSDGKGLYLLVTKAGKYWRFDYSFSGKRKTLAFGTYPEVPLTAARDKRTAARELVAADIDPSVDKQQKAAQKLIDEETFRTVALEWHEACKCDWSEDHAGRVKTKHFAAPTSVSELAPILRAIDSYTGSYIVKTALRILPQLLIRPGNLREMEWSEINFDAVLWTVPAEKMKMRLDHVVPLSRQVLAILKEIHALSGSGQYVFTNHRDVNKPLSKNAFNEAFHKMGFTGNDIVAHGLRATARTMLHEVLKCDPDVIEAQLAHTVLDRLGKAYNRTKHIEDRTSMMQKWSDYLDEIKKPCKVIEIKQTAR